MAKMSRWLGITTDESLDEADGKIRVWSGVRASTKFAWLAIWVALAVMAFLLAEARMPDADGFGGFVPLYVAVLIFTAGIAVTERTVLRTEPIVDGDVLTDPVD